MVITPKAPTSFFEDTGGGGPGVPSSAPYAEGSVILAACFFTDSLDDRLVRINPLLEDIVSLQSFIVGIHHPCIATPTPAKPILLHYYCTTIARYTPPPPSPLLCHTPYSIGDGSIVLTREGVSVVVSPAPYAEGSVTLAACFFTETLDDRLVRPASKRKPTGSTRLHIDTEKHSYITDARADNGN